MGIFKRLFGKNSRPKHSTASTLLEDLKKVKEQIEELVSVDITSAEYIRNDLVDPHVLNGKIREFTAAANRMQNDFDNMLEFLQCLHNWVHTPPPLPKSRKDADELVNIILGEEDQEFLDKLEAAKRAQKENT